MNKKLLTVPLFAVLIALGALFLTRGGGSSGGSAEAAAQVAAAFVKVEELTSVSARISSVVTTERAIIEVKQQITSELPDRAYVRTEVDSRVSEVVVLGERVVVKRFAYLPWEETDFRSLGIDPNALYDTEQEAFLPSKLIVVGEVVEDGVEKIHYYQKTDGQELKELLERLFLEDSRIRNALEQTVVEEIETDYLIGKYDQLPYRATVRVKATENGIEVETVSIIEYFDFNVPLVLPEDLPLTP